MADGRRILLVATISAEWRRGFNGAVRRERREIDGAFCTRFGPSPEQVQAASKRAAVTS